MLLLTKLHTAVSLTNSSLEQIEIWQISLVIDHDDTLLDKAEEHCKHCFSIQSDCLQPPQFPVSFYKICQSGQITSLDVTFYAGCTHLK